MRVSILTVGDELLAGDVENTNATWLASELTDRGAVVREIVVLPDDIGRLSSAVADHSDRFDAVVVTGGLGSTPDDVTVRGVASALDRDVVRDERTAQLVGETVERIREEYPSFDFDLDRGARRPAGSTPIENEEGIAPGFVVENVFALPGIPDEMRATFQRVADDLAGSLHVRSVVSREAESHLTDLLRSVGTEFDISVGCYPGRDRETKRITVRGDADVVRAAQSWLLDRPEVAGTLEQERES